MLLISNISMILIEIVQELSVNPGGDKLADTLTIISIIVGGIGFLAVVIRLSMYFQKQKDKVKSLEEDSAIHIRPSIDRIDNKIEQRLIPSINEINTGISYLRGAMSQILTQDFTKTQSPKSLNEKGTKIVKDSGVDSIVEQHFDYILERVRTKGPTNAYQAQEAIVEVVKSLATREDLKEDLEMGSFRSGYEIDIVLYVGAYYIRDRILESLGLVPDDIDNDDPSVSKPSENL